MSAIGKLAVGQFILCRFVLMQQYKFVDRISSMCTYVIEMKLVSLWKV